MGNEIVVFKADKNGFDAVPATEPTLYFIGVTTGHSSIMKVFPEWSKHMGLGAVIKGIDIGIHEDPEVYRKVVEFIKNDPLSKGALVTTHKLDLCNATKDMFDYDCEFPENSLVWEINYRGDLTFMHQAEKQAEAKNLHVEDGWRYFIYGWTQVIAEVFHTPIEGKLLDELDDIAKGFRS